MHELSIAFACEAAPPVRGRRPVGLLELLRSWLGYLTSGSGGTRAGEGARPTNKIAMSERGVEYARS